MDHIRIPSNFNEVTLQEVMRMQGKCRGYCPSMSEVHHQDH